MNTERLDPLIADCAKKHGLPRNLVAAIVQAESGGCPWAIRYEPAFFERYIKGKGVKGRGRCSDDTEARARAMSWGLMQIMGATARETGFAGEFLSELVTPSVALEWGCKYLKRLHDRYAARGIDAVVAAYNGGSPRPTDSGHWVNQAYVDKIKRLGGFA